MLLNASGRIVGVNSAGHPQITGLHKGIVAVGSSSDLSILAGSSRKMGATTFHVTFGHCLAISRIGSSTLLENTASKMRASVECFGAGSFCTGILRAAVQHASNTLQWNNCLVTLLKFKVRHFSNCSSCAYPILFAKAVAKKVGKSENMDERQVHLRPKRLAPCSNFA